MSEISTPLAAEVAKRIVPAVEVAAMLQTAPRTLRGWRKTRGFPAPIRRGAYDLHAVLRWLEAQGGNHGAP